MAFIEDFTPFFNVDDFAISALFTPEGGVAVEVHGIFDDDYIGVDGDGQVAIASSTPVFHCATANVANAYDGTLVIGATHYRIVEPKSDGTGTTMLILQEQS